MRGVDFTHFNIAVPLDCPICCYRSYSLEGRLRGAVQIMFQAWGGIRPCV